MRVDDAITYPDVTAERVFAMLRDPQFQREKCAATGAISYDVDISSADGRTVITCRRTLPTDGLPDFVRPFTAHGLNLVETIDWAAPTDAGARGADVRLAFTGQPLTMTGRLDLRSDDAGATAVLVANLVAAVPLLGGRIEKACEPLIHMALRTEESLGREWLAAGR